MLGNGSWRGSRRYFTPPQSGWHGDAQDAINRFRLAAGLDNILPAERANALSNLGHAYLQLGDYADARQSFALAIRTHPGQYSAWIGLGVALEKSGQPGLAVKAYSNALQLQPTDWEWLLLAQALEESGQISEAQHASEQARLASHDLDRARQTANHILGK